MMNWETACGALEAFLKGERAELQAVRRYLHAHPEPSGEEFQTSAYLADRLEELGAQYRLGPDGRGLIVDSAPPGAGLPVIAFRADIDALRMQDEKTVSYRSQEMDLMHACGHDAHTAIAFGVVKALVKMPDLLPDGVAWRCIFQPAEEIARGAKEMMSCGALEDVVTIIALHVEPGLHVGQIGIREGALTAACEEFEFQIEGQGGHGARPHTTRDPIAAAAQLIQSIYANVPRSVDAFDHVVVSFGVIQGGMNPNVIPNSVHLRGTIRSFDVELARMVKGRMREIADGMAQMHALNIRFSVGQAAPSVINDPLITSLCREAAQGVVGEEGVIQIERPSMGGEDFAWYLTAVPGCLIRLGAGTPLRPVRHLHSTNFDIDERCLAIGTQTIALALHHIGHHYRSHYTD